MGSMCSTPVLRTLSVSQLNDILTECGYRVLESDLSSIIVEQINKDFSDSNEAAMFLAHLIHESGGFQLRKEKNEGRGQPYVPYYGRGFIQLTWENNYRAASESIFQDDRLVRDPDLVSRTAEMSMCVSVWFWVTNVRPAGGPRENKFGKTTKAINPIEKGPRNDAAKKRYEHYKVAANILRVSDLASEEWD